LSTNAWKRPAIPALHVRGTGATCETKPSIGRSEPLKVWLCASTIVHAPSSSLQALAGASVLTSTSEPAQPLATRLEAPATN
jgi:hypothetical protein